MLLGREFRHLHKSDGVVQVDFDLFRVLGTAVGEEAKDLYGRLFGAASFSD
jgi:hypothetical protein